MILSPSYTNGRDLLTSPQVCETGDGYNQRLDFAKFTMAHGHFALMGGFTVGVPPTTDDGLPIHENSESQEVVSLRPQQLFALFEKEDPREARFDLFTQISEVQIKQLHEYSSTGHLVTISGRLLMFVWYCYQRQHLGLETSPLEVLTVGHVFLTVVIEIFWWNKLPYLRLPIQNLDRQALCRAVPGLEQELEEVAAAQGKNTVDAYMSFQNFRLAGQLLWPPTQFDKVGPKINASYRAVIVFGLSACHIAILLLPTWRVNLSDTEAWRKNLEYAFRICAGIAVVAALDTVVRHIWRKSPKFRKLYDGIEDATPVNGTIGGAASYAIYTISLILSLGPNARTNILICLYAAAVAMAVSEVYRASEGVYAVGPGDVPKYDLNIFGTE
jgi:hypothetical protein